MFIIDVQGFQYGQLTKFMCKEITIINNDTGDSIHKFIQYPLNGSCFNIKLEKHFKWLTQNLHGLEFNVTPNDLIGYEEIADFLKKNIPNDVEVVVKGIQKKYWLSTFLTNEIINLEDDESCPNFEQLKTIFKSYHCNKHVINTLNCTTENVNFLYSWLQYCKK